MECLYSAHILSWEERIAFLVDDDKWLSALALALEFYEVRSLPPLPFLKSRQPNY